MVELTNTEIKKAIHKTLDPIMKKERFHRNDRTYYKQVDNLVFVLGTEAVGAHFSTVTGWPSYAFSVSEGIWVDGISPAIVKQYPKKDKNGIYIPKIFNTFHINMKSDNVRYGIERRMENPYMNLAADLGITNPAEKSRRDFWIMPADESQQVDFLVELQEVIQEKFLACYLEYVDFQKLERLILENPRNCNVEAGYIEGMNFSKGALGNLKHFLEYATLFYQHYGPQKTYQMYLKDLENWSAANKREIPPCYYCGYGKKFEL